MTEWNTHKVVVTVTFITFLGTVLGLSAYYITTQPGITGNAGHVTSGHALSAHLPHHVPLMKIAETIIEQKEKGRWLWL